MELGRKYKVVYKDKDYTKFASGILLANEEHLIEINDYKDGKLWIGKSSITIIKEIGVGDRNDRKTAE
jgi:hypothetical protein